MQIGGCKIFLIQFSVAVTKSTNSPPYALPKVRKHGQWNTWCAKQSWCCFRRACGECHFGLKSWRKVSIHSAEPHVRLRVVESLTHSNSTNEIINIFCSLQYARYAVRILPSLCFLVLNRLWNCSLRGLHEWTQINTTATRSRASLSTRLQFLPEVRH